MALSPNDRRERSLDWAAAHRLIDAVQEKLVVESRRLQTLLEESRRRLKPLGEPFDVDLGTHRWLSGEREEAYSDWLAWAIEQVREPELVLRLLGLAPRDVSAWSNTSFDVKREIPIPYGHDERTGRLDLLIRYPGKAVIVVEVKLVTAEEADLTKQKGYRRWLDEQRKEECRSAVLLAVDAGQQNCEGFEFVSWSHVCGELRRLASRLVREQNLIVPAMILAFVGAVEQNVLGFPAALVQNIVRGRSHLFNAKVVYHLAQWLTKEE